MRLPLLLCLAFAASSPAAPLDRLTLGDAASEQAHHLAEVRSEAYAGALHQSARRLRPPAEPGWQGGWIRFVMQVQPEGQNYLTARFWGGAADRNLLILFCAGKQVGYRHLGDIEELGAPDDEPRAPGCFYYVTTPLPRALTQGKHEVELEVRATGGIWGYGTKFEQYQRPMTEPSRGLYRFYTHAEGTFVPPAEEVQGATPAGTVRAEPGEEVMAEVERRVNGALGGLLKEVRPPDQMQLQFLAHAYATPGNVATGNPAVLEQVVRGVDALHATWQAKPDEVWQDRSTWNPGWFGVGPAADAVRLLAAPLGARLEEKLPDGAVRRTAWAELFAAGRDWLYAHRRTLANQAMFTDGNAYLSNKALQALHAPQAQPEEAARQPLYESAGLIPWVGVAGAAPLGTDFRQITTRGLTREFGYVGMYGEVGTNGVLSLYETTRAPGGAGDPRLREQLARMLRARAWFRYPALDGEGNRALRLERMVGWRDPEFPGDVLYMEPTGGDASVLASTAATLEPRAVGAVQQMLRDHQLYASVRRHLEDRRFRSTVGLLGLREDLRKILAQPAGGPPLPMTPGQPDALFADEEDGVVALKHGEEILYASLYWRARSGVNFLARIHYLTPAWQQTAVVREEVEFEPSGLTWRRPDWINFGFGNGGTNLHYPPDLHSAEAGEELPIAAMAPGVAFKPGQENPFAGRGEFYRLQFGPYFIAMNMGHGKSYPLVVPAGWEAARQFPSGAPAPPTVAAQSTVVLRQP